MCELWIKFVPCASFATAEFPEQCSHFCWAHTVTLTSSDIAMFETSRVWCLRIGGWEFHLLAEQFPVVRVGSWDFHVQDQELGI